MMHVICATGDPELDDAMLRRLPTSCPACQPDEVLSAAEREGADAVVLGERLGGEDCLDLAVRLRCGGWRVLWLYDRDTAAGQRDRERTLTLVAVGIYDLLEPPVTVERLLARLRHPATLADGLAAVDGAARLRSATAGLRSRLIALAPRQGPDGDRAAGPVAAGGRRQTQQRAERPGRVGGEIQVTGDATAARTHPQSSADVGDRTRSEPGTGAHGRHHAALGSVTPLPAGFAVREGQPDPSWWATVGWTTGRGQPGEGATGGRRSGPLGEGRPPGVGSPSGAKTGEESILVALSAGSPAGVLHAALLRFEVGLPSRVDGLLEGPQPRSLGRLAPAVRAAVGAMEGTLRRDDRLVPWGEGCFLLLLPGADHAGAQAAVARVRGAAAACGLALSAGLADLGAAPDAAGTAPPSAASTLGSLVDRAARAVEEDRARRWHESGERGIIAFLGALPGCGTTRAAMLWAAERSVLPGGAVLVDGHLERPHLATYLLGRPLDPLDTADRARSWWQARSAAALRRCLQRILPGLWLLPAGSDGLWGAPDASGSHLPAGSPGVSPLRQGRAARERAAAPRASQEAVRESTWPSPAGSGAAPGVRAPRSGTAAVRETSASEEVAGAAGTTPRAARVTVRRHAGARGAGGADAPRRPSRGRRPRSPGTAVPAAAQVSSVGARLSEAVRAATSVASAVGVDLGAPACLVHGAAEPRIAWAATRAQVVVVTRPDRLGREASQRLLTTLRHEAARAGRALQARVLLSGVATDVPLCRAGTGPPVSVVDP